MTVEHDKIDTEHIEELLARLERTERRLHLLGLCVRQAILILLGGLDAFLGLKRTVPPKHGCEG